MKAANKAEVVIGGEIVTLMSVENEEYMHKLARYIDRKLEEIKNMKSCASINDRTRTLFIAVNIADDYFKVVNQFRRLEAEHTRFVAEMGRMQEENHLLTEKIHSLQDQLNESRAELEAYIETFDERHADKDADKHANGESTNVVNLNQLAVNN